MYIFQLKCEIHATGSNGPINIRRHKWITKLQLSYGKRLGKKSIKNRKKIRGLQVRWWCFGVGQNMNESVIANVY